MRAATRSGVRLRPRPARGFAAGGLCGDIGIVQPAIVLQLSQSKPANRKPSLPGAICRCRSAMSQLAVRRGSITTTRLCGLCLRASAMRW